MILKLLYFPKILTFIYIESNSLHEHWLDAAITNRRKRSVLVNHGKTFLHIVEHVLHLQAVPTTHGCGVSHRCQQTSFSDGFVYFCEAAIDPESMWIVPNDTDGKNISIEDPCLVNVGHPCDVTANVVCLMLVLVNLHDDDLTIFYDDEI